MSKTAIVSVISSMSALVAPLSMPLLFPTTPLQEHRQEQARIAEVQSSGESCAAMQQMREQMMARMREADATVATLVEEMNESTGQKKVDAMAALLSELVVQRKAMREHMMPMHERMMQHMMEHMAAAMPDDMRTVMHESMQQCPMMKHMHGREEAGAHGDYDGDRRDHDGDGRHNNHGHSER